MKALALALSLFLIMPPHIGWAQFLRLGPFDFDASTFFDTIYTSNVENERPSEATADREDLYFVWGLDLISRTDVGPRSRLTLDTGVAIEKHLNRPDLDNSQAPFGRVIGRVDSDWDPFFFFGGFRYERTSESLEEVFAPGRSRKTRQVGTTREYDVGADFITQNIQFGTKYTYTEERYDDDKHLLDETNEDKFEYYLTLSPHRYLSAEYTMDATRTDFINRPDGSTGWKRSEEITININITEAFNLFERPKVEYGIGVEREFDEDGEGDGWELVHRLTISDSYEISPAVKWGYFASYLFEQNPEDDDVNFQFGGFLDHQISPRTAQRFSAARRPVDTLGSTEDTAETEYSYSLRISDFLLQNVNFRGSYSYTISEPTVGDTERLVSWQVGVAHTVLLNPRLTRSLGYQYQRDTSNLEPEALDEHRVTLSFVFRF